MAADKLTLTPSVFNKFFQLFSSNVQAKRLKKLDYDLWKSINSYLQSAKSSEHLVKLWQDDENLYLDFDLKVVTINKEKDADFCTYLSSNLFIPYLYKCKVCTYDEPNKNKTVIKEKENMNTTFNFDFGQLNSNLVGLSPYGLAVMNPASNKFIAWDAKSKALIDVETLNFPEGREFFYKIPVAVKEIKAGDIIMHQYGPAFVTEVSKDYSTITVVSPNSCEQRTIVPVKSIFGFNFVTKIVSLFGDGQFTASEDAPFGNMLPLLLLSKNKDINPLIFLTMGGQADFTKNPLLLYALMGDNTNSNALLPLLFMNNNIFKAQE